MNPTTTTPQNPNAAAVLHDFFPFFKVYHDGRVEKYMVQQPVPAGLDPSTGVQSRDTVISPDHHVSARLFLPPAASHAHKLPLILHFHGGGFCIGSPFDAISLNFLNSLAAAANAIIVSVDYRLAPEHPLPIAYDDSWAGLQWALSHANRAGPEPWLNDHVDFKRVFLAGESAGANIAHDVALRAGEEGLDDGVRLAGLILVHPFFGGDETDLMYKFLCPTSSGSSDDPRLNPRVDGRMARLGCGRVVVMVAEKDGLREWGRRYYEWLKECGWHGEAEFVETEGEDHCFHLFDMNSDKREALMLKLASFVNREG